MTSYTNLSIRVATAVVGGAITIGSLLAATPAFAYYYPPAPVYTDPVQACSGATDYEKRFDPNCIEEQNAYINTIVEPYQYGYQYNSYNNYSNYNYGYAPQRYVPQTYSYYPYYNTPQYSNYNTYYSNGYSYQYQYGYSY